MMEMSSNFCMKFATQIQFCVATKTIMSSELWCEPDYFEHCNSIIIIVVVVVIIIIIIIIIIILILLLI